MCPVGPCGLRQKPKSRKSAAKSMLEVFALVDISASLLRSVANFFIFDTAGGVMFNFLLVLPQSLLAPQVPECIGSGTDINIRRTYYHAVQTAIVSVKCRGLFAASLIARSFPPTLRPSCSRPAWFGWFWSCAVIGMAALWHSRRLACGRTPPNDNNISPSVEPVSGSVIRSSSR